MNTRRAFLLSSGSIFALFACSKGSEPTGETEPVNNVVVSDRDREMGELMANQFRLDPVNSMLNQPGNNAAPLASAVTSSATNIALARAEIGDDPTKRYFYWPEDDAITFDYAHIAALGNTVDDAEGNPIPTGIVSDAFDVTSETLATIVNANYFDHKIDKILAANPPAENRMVVALRGAEIVDDETGQNGFVRLRDIRPNHRTASCVFIAWNRGAETADLAMRAFPGSTVPSEIYLAAYQSIGNGYRSCMIPQGLHQRVIGNMRNHTNTLRQHSSTPVIREPSGSNDFYQVGVSEWDPSTADGRLESVGAHIHCAYWDANTNEDDYWRFSSQGCQTINGLVRNDEVFRDIGDFYDAMAIPSAVMQDDGTYGGEKYGTVYPMMLISGTEARLHSHGAELAIMRRVRIGSSVDIEAEPDHPIVALQSALGIDEPDGDFGGRSMLRLIDVQSSGAWGPARADGIVTPSLAARQEIELT